MKSNPLVDLSRQYAVLVVNICNSIKERGKSNALVNQFIRSGTSIGANVSEAERGQTKPDFYAKLSIALKEANETCYWIRLLHATDYLDDKEFTSLFADANELVSILVAICKSKDCS